MDETRDIDTCQTTKPPTTEDRPTPPSCPNQEQVTDPTTKEATMCRFQIIQDQSQIGLSLSVTSNLACRKPTNTYIQPSSQTSSHSLPSSSFDSHNVSLTSPTQANPATTKPLGTIKHADPNPTNANFYTFNPVQLEPSNHPHPSTLSPLPTPHLDIPTRLHNNTNTLSSLVCGRPSQHFTPPSSPIIPNPSLCPTSPTSATSATRPPTRPLLQPAIDTILEMPDDRGLMDTSAATAFSYPPQPASLAASGSTSTWILDFVSGELTPPTSHHFPSYRCWELAKISRLWATKQ